MVCIHVLKQKHAVVPLEVVKDDYDASIVSVPVDGHGFQFVDETTRAVVAVQYVAVVALRRLVSDEDRRLVSLLVRDGFVVRIDEQRRFPFHLHHAFLRWSQRSSIAHVPDGHALRLGIVVLLRYLLYVALVLVQVHVLVAELAIGVSASMSVSRRLTPAVVFDGIQLATFGAFLQPVALGFARTGRVRSQTFLAHESPMTAVAWHRRFGVSPSPAVVLAVVHSSQVIE